MSNVSHRQRRAAKKLGVKGPVLQAYVILDPSHRPDLRGEFAGVKVKQLGGQSVVYLSNTAAKFYLDSGSIEPLVKPVAEAKESVESVV